MSAVVVVHGQNRASARRCSDGVVAKLAGLGALVGRGDPNGGDGGARGGLRWAGGAKTHGGSELRAAVLGLVVGDGFLVVRGC